MDTTQLDVTQYNIKIIPGTDFKLVALIKDKTTTPPVARDLTGYSAHMQIRPSPSSGTVLQDITSPVISGTGLDLTAVNTGFITAYINDTVTATYTWTSGVYDLRIISSTGFAEVVLRGAVTIVPRVTV